MGGARGSAGPAVPAPGSPIPRPPDQVAPLLAPLAPRGRVFERSSIGARTVGSIGLRHSRPSLSVSSGHLITPYGASALVSAGSRETAARRAPLSGGLLYSRCPAPRRASDARRREHLVANRTYRVTLGR